MSFADVVYASRRVTTRKEEFLRQTDEPVWWSEWCELMAPFWHPADGLGRGRRAVPVERMPGACLPRCRHDLPGVATEEAACDTPARTGVTRRVSFLLN